MKKLKKNPKIFLGLYSPVHGQADIFSLQVNIKSNIHVKIKTTLSHST